MLEFVDVSPHFRLPAFIMNGGFAAGGAAGVQLSDGTRGNCDRSGRELDKDAAHLLDVFVVADNMLVAQQVTEGQLSGFLLGLGAGVNRKPSKTFPCTPSLPSRG